MRGVMPAGIGVAVGMAAALGLTRFLGTLLYGVAPIDAATFTIIPVALLTEAAGSVFIPAARAARVEPVEALRAE